MELEIVKKDSLLLPYADIISRRIKKIQETEKRLTQNKIDLVDFASGHEYFGLHFKDNEWIFREWAPNASAIYLIGNMTDWKKKENFSLNQINSNGVWEIRLPSNALSHGDIYRLYIHWQDGEGNRIPSYARRVIQDHRTLIFNAQVWKPDFPYKWQISNFKPQQSSLFIYEAHVGMAQNEEKIGIYREFKDNILPRIAKAGYNTIQLMAIQEHPYYGSFGYQVSSFFAASSRFGTPEELKELIDTAHSYGISVIMDIIHSHSVANEIEGLSKFDGTLYQYFHDGDRGYHEAWQSRCFDYGKIEVLHFLLSNCRFWLDEYHFDGFRFDGVTSMLYLHHGLGKSFIGYDCYFDETVDEEAICYLALANKVIHKIKENAITIAEDVSGMPGLATPIQNGGVGFDFRFAMGIPDYWIKLTKDTPDEYWHLGYLWHELTNKRYEEKTISYAESHDQAIVGDQTIIFRLIGYDMIDGMNIDRENLKIDRGIAIHKLIRLITLATASNGYLNFMGNEFGHPEWIDFPREGNNWSFNFARRQWHLVDNSFLKYQFLNNFDRDMINFAKKSKLLESPMPNILREHFDDKIIVFERAGLLFLFNFHPNCSHFSYPIECDPGSYKMIFDSDRKEYGGHNRLIPNHKHLTLYERSDERERHYLMLYLPNRTGIILQKED
ncbi:MAG: alpha amylase C-terminal domain-containing protein [Desulfobacterales bacterium]|nr:alpha amylase C-terminal domain-containing protein [Desulfobacterales bacterium]MBF0398825.1 alpha amylase C-terminal domain-containing protein [Desulfobacterales bacterium]